MDSKYSATLDTKPYEDSLKRMVEAAKNSSASIEAALAKVEARDARAMRGGGMRGAAGSISTGAMFGSGAMDTGGRSGRILVGEYTKAVERARAETDKAESSVAKLALRTATYGYAGRLAMRGVTESLRAFAAQSDDGAAKLAVMSSAWEDFKASIGRDILSGGGEGVFGSLLSGIEAARRGVVDFVADTAASVMTFSNAFGASAKDRDGQIAQEKRSKEAKVLAEQAAEAARKRAEEEKKAAQIREEADRRAKEAKDLANRADVQRMNLAAEAAKLEGKEGLAGELERRAQLRERLIEIERTYTDEKQRQLLVEETLINAGRAEDAARREAAEKAAGFAREAADATRASILAAQEGNANTAAAAKLAAMRLEQERQLARLKEAGVSEERLAGLRTAQEAERQAMLVSLARGEVASERDRGRSVGPGAFAIAGQQVVGKATSDEQKNEAARKRIMAALDRLVRLMEGVEKNTGQGSVAVFGV